MLKITIGIIGVVVVIWIGFVLLRGFGGIPTSTETPTEPIKIGFIGSLTGNAAAFGESERHGAAIAENEINAAGGVNGRPIKVIYEDGKCTEEDAANVAQKLIAINKVKFIIGGTCSLEVFGAAPIAESARVILFSPSATNPQISKMGDYIFRNIPHDGHNGERLAALIYQDYQKLAVISEKTDLSYGIREVFREAFIDSYIALGGEIVFNESFVAETTDFRSILFEMKATNPKAIFINPQTARTAKIIAKQTREIGMSQQFYFIYLSFPEYVESGPAAEGSIIFDVPDLDSKNSKSASFLAAYQTKYNKWPNFSFFAGAAYDILYLLVDGIRQHGEDADEVKDYLYALGGYSGTIGTYQFDDNGDVNGIEFNFNQIQDGALVSFVE